MTHTEMQLEKPESVFDQEVLKINDTSYTVNVQEIESFVDQCKRFMPLHNYNDFELMTQEISDSLVEFTRGDVPMEQIRPQLLFLREIGFLLKGLLTPVEEN